ncbi:uncharacterized protein LOC130509156 [Raphanus sativus]|uniref:Uncharacterized protein LOC130509156 n=1 Tax=Raphanus sativus TaxID=3726 RepID=A0A9W3DAT5_RAPSA|nr:uncharacterized protein LOC130509156 [Raphanus sativus]
MDHDYVIQICDSLGVCPEEALLYLEGKWNIHAAMEACRTKTLPSINVPSSHSQPSAVEACPSINVSSSPSKPSAVEACPSISVASSPSNKPSAVEACRNKPLPSINVAYSPSKPSAVEACPSINVASSPSRHSLEAPLLSSVSQATSKNGEIENITEQDSRVPMVNMPLPAHVTRWSAYVKTCNEMIFFLTAAALAYLPIRFMIDEQKKCGANLRFQDYLEMVLALIEGFHKVDPFIFCSFAYAGFYLLASGSFSPFTVRVFEASSIISGFAMVFVVIIYHPLLFT